LLKKKDMLLTSNVLNRFIVSRLWALYTQSLEQRPLTTKVIAASLIFFTSDSIAQYLTFNPKNESESSLTNVSNNNNNNNRIIKDKNESSALSSSSESDSSSLSVFQWDSTRAMSSACFGIVGTTWIHYWWSILENIVGSRIPVRQYRITNTITKVVIDQTCSAPLYIYTYFIITNYLQNRKSSSNTNNVTTTRETIDSDRSSTRSRIDDLNAATTKASTMLVPTLLQHWKLWPAVHCLNFYFIPLQHRVIVQNTVLVGWSGYLSYLNHNKKTNAVSATATTLHQYNDDDNKNTTTTISDTNVDRSIRRRKSVSVVITTNNNNNINDDKHIEGYTQPSTSALATSSLATRQQISSTEQQK
jgi:protein Mpv17